MDSVLTNSYSIIFLISILLTIALCIKFKAENIYKFLLKLFIIVLFILIVYKLWFLLINLNKISKLINKKGMAIQNFNKEAIDFNNNKTNLASF